MSQKNNFINVFAVQLNSTNDVNKNFYTIKKTLNKINRKDQYDNLICFPENCLFFRLKENEKNPFINLKSSYFQEIAQIAKDKNLNIHLGSVPIIQKSSCFNASIFISDIGEIHLSYKKIHLFDIKINNKLIKESKNFKAGKKINTFNIGNWKFGQSICYDLRFPEIFIKYSQIPVDVILVPAAFLWETGRFHWEVLLRARAIESQSYVVASAQVGLHKDKHGNTRKTYGHTMIIDPWGRIINMIQVKKPAIIKTTLNKGIIQAVRKQLPVFKHRKLIKNAMKKINKE